MSCGGKPMRFRSVCSGIDAASVAWKPLGWECVELAEIEPFPCSVLKYHYPEIPNAGDFTSIRMRPSRQIAPADVLVGGTPCQSFSVAGLRKGLDDDRGQLMLEFLRLAHATRPRWVLWENVPGVLSSVAHIAPDPSPPPPPLDMGRDGAEVETEDVYDSEELHAFNCFLVGLSELGYGWAYRVLDAQYAGVPQRRRRVFVVGCLGDWRGAAAVLFERHSLSGDHPPGRDPGAIVASALTCSLGSGGPDAARAQANHLIPRVYRDSGQSNWGEGCGPLTAHDAKDGYCSGLVTHTLRGDGFDASEDGTGRGTPLVAVPFDTTQITSAANYSNPGPGDPCHPLAAGAHPPAIAFHANQDPIGGEISPCLPTHHGHIAVATGWAVRRLTPLECERLQGFPDAYTLVPFRGKPAADGPRYKALGNSMAVPCMRWLGERIQLVEEVINA